MAAGSAVAEKAPVVSPIMPVDAFPEPLPQIAEEEAAMAPPTFKPKPIEQQVAPLHNGSFMILPKESPLPRGTVTRDMLGHTDVQTITPPSVARPVMAPEKEVKATLATNKNGQQVVRLEGVSQGRGYPSRKIQFAASAAPTKPEVTKPAPPEVAAPAAPEPAKPEMMEKTLRLSYFADEAHPQDVIPLAKFLAQIKGKKVVHLAVTMQATPVPLVGEDISLQRWHWLAKQFKEADVTIANVPTSEIWLKHPTQQFLEVELAYLP